MGNLPGGSVRSHIYFFKLDLSDIIIQALPPGQLVLTNSIARTLGLHDFYQVGLWNFCEGYKDTYVTSPICSTALPLITLVPASASSRVC